jgi:hypothetical protein
MITYDHYEFYTSVVWLSWLTKTNPHPSMLPEHIHQDTLDIMNGAASFVQGVYKVADEEISLEDSMEVLFDLLAIIGTGSEYLQ